MPLHRSIPLQKSVEQWLTRLQESITETLRIDLHACVKDIDNGLPYEELVSKVNRSIKIKIKTERSSSIPLVHLSSVFSWIALWMDTRSRNRHRGM
jgi:hypothetical protein